MNNSKIDRTEAKSKLEEENKLDTIRDISLDQLNLNEINENFIESQPKMR